MEGSLFEGVVELAVARADAWCALWLLFLAGSIGIVWWSHTDRVDLNRAVAISFTFVLLAGGIGFWLSAVHAQRVALFKFAAAIADTASAAASTHEPVEVAWQRIEQAGVVGSIEPLGQTAWLVGYFATCAFVLCAIWLLFKRYERQK